MKDRKRFLRGVYWEALLIVKYHKLMGMPYYTYMWWNNRLKLIKVGII